MRIKTITAATLIASAILMSSAFAQTQSMLDVLDIDLTGYKPEEAFKIFDENGNGTISDVEWRLRILTIFYKKDADEDGFIDAKDVPGIGKSIYAKIDRNKDGKLSVMEWIDRRTIRHADLDANKDGSVTLEELKAFVQK